MSAFLDTNVLLYLLSSDTAKADRAEKLVAASSVVSVQVLNEFVAVARRKLRMAWPEIAEVTSTLQQLCLVEPVTLEIHNEARRLAEAHQLAWYDAVIVSAALEARCSTLYSEDMQHGMRIEKSLTIRNPFR